jgi:hypothetical protein
MRVKLLLLKLLGNIMLYLNESLNNINLERAEYVRLTSPTFEPFQRASDLVEVEDSTVARAWISRNGLTIITTSAAQTIYDGHVARGDQSARTLS